MVGQIEKNIRYQIFKQCHESGGGHIASSLSMVEILWSIFSAHYKAPHDRFLLSSCQGALALYSVQYALKREGFQLSDFLKEGSDLTMFPNTDLAFSDMTSGSLGHGISMAVGMGLHKRFNAAQEHTLYVVVGDGELDEGSNWEGLMAAAHFSINNLIVIVNYNKVQIDGPTAMVMNIEPLQDKLTAFGCDVLSVNGHDTQAISDAISTLKCKKTQGPSVLIAHTVKGHGISFCTKDLSWHYRIPTALELDFVKDELNVH
ncbi:Transketolase, N-terminal section [Pseudomonas synxantha]|uniref:Transketolase, N-terminal section n=1 Tax=Pseudomonas synxantha TaxID=47883 RepID=A0A3G7UD42_9PSED|nr:1-deoxy-D-xylulose-5-phosphate synthase N-terminal domain-containing protein [Pseudomonas synxantha]AZE56442.1 Transketolase, N-terminal section [Pseudomonas synxantha]